MRSVALVSALLTLPCTAQAATVLTNEQLELEVFGYARAGYQIVDQGPAFSHETYLALARLAARATLTRWGSAFVQVAGDNGTITMLDAIAEFRPHEALSIEVGRMRTPTSADLMIPAPFIPFTTRSLMFSRGFVEGRLTGAQLVGRVDTEAVDAQIHLGVFNPEPAAGVDANAKHISARALVSTPFGLHLHVAFLDLVHEQPTPIPLDQRFDVAAWFERDGWTFFGEAAFAFDAAQDGVPYALYVYVLKRIPVGEDGLELQPGARYDFVHGLGDAEHRVTAGLTLFVLADRMNAAVNYELATRSDTSHTVYLQLQAGF